MSLVFMMLVGVPGAGKSTFLKKYIAENGFEPNSYAVISSDKYVEKYAREAGKTYSEVFQDVAKQANAAMNMELHHAILDGKHIFWDQTNTSIKNRKNKLSIIPSFYRKLGVFFETPSMDILESRLNNDDRAGKHIPHHVITSMINNLDVPTEAEGFHEIIVLRNT